MYHEDIIALLFEIAQAHGNLGEHKQELQFYQKVLKLQQKSLPSDDPQLADTMCSIGRALSRLGKHTGSSSLEKYNIALAILEKVYSSTNRKILKIRRGMAEQKQML